MTHSTFQIDGHLVGGSSVFVIAEIGNNHNGSLELALELVDSAIAAGANCVKFQLRNREALYRTRANGAIAEDLGAEYVQDLLNKVELSLSKHHQIRAYCKERGITYMCTPWDESSVDALATMDVPAFKLASADLFNPYLIAKVAALGKPIVLSTGMSYEHEIIRTTVQLKQFNVPFALLHCNSAYPAPYTDIQLPYIARLRDLHSVVGYSGHERGIAISLAAVSLGACIIERHITLDRSMEGPDHLASLEPTEFKQLVDGIRQVEQSMNWAGPARHVSQGELLNRENLSKSVVAARNIKLGETFTADCLRVASPGQGLAPYKLDQLLGKTSQRDLAQGDFLFESDITGEASLQRQFEFPIKWGIPVRYHDFQDFEKLIKPDLFEFHLSYRDLHVNPKDFLRVVNCTRLVVHAPELFENSELLDLASSDEAYRSRSIANLQRVVDATLTIAEYFPNADSYLIVANVGGFSADEPFPLEHRHTLYERFQSACKQVNFGKTELIPQNMAPFPWHFGGQRHQNIFMMPAELIKQAKAHGLRLCLDLAHLMMTCNHFGLNFEAELEMLLPVTAHLHVADASGTNGEGVVMGTGNVNWPSAWSLIAQVPTLSFIPEVWQGHKDHGSGFWHALKLLQEIQKKSKANGVSG
jgi:sialic acid synthase SpsE/sugar phosphate isomerase/epimerase